MQGFVAGFRHYEGMGLLDSMKEGDLLELVREPNNEYDSCAIALHWRGKKIGFIPSSVNEMLSYLLDADALSLFAVITHLEKNTKPWENVAIAVYFIQEVNKDLPAHAHYLTRIEAPHYRTLKKKDKGLDERTYSLEDVLESTDRVINLEKIPENHPEAKAFFSKYYSKFPIKIDQPGQFVQVKDDGIYSFLYDLSDEVICQKDTEGKKFLEFFVA